MKAIVSKFVGGPETLVLEEVPDPSPGPGDVLINVKAASINYPDLLMMEDRYQFRALHPFVPGGEIAGVVSRVGAQVTNVKPGDRVQSTCGTGGLAEKIVVAAATARIIPDIMPFDEAAAFLTTYGTAHFALKERARVRPGQSLLVLGAAGGVGLAAVDLGKAMGMKVIAAASSQTKVDFAIAAGADRGLVYAEKLDREGQRSFSDAIKAVARDGVDVVYDGVGGDYSEPALRAISWEGVFLIIGFPAGIARMPLNLPLLKGCQIVGVFWGAFIARNPEANEANIADLFSLYAEGKIRPRISKRYRLADGAQAIRDLAARNVLGKIVVTMD